MEFGVLGQLLVRDGALGGDVSARIRTRGSSYLIEIGDDEFDALRLGVLREAGRTASADGEWAAAVRYFHAAEALFRGEPLADVPSDRLRREHGQRLIESRLHRSGRQAEALARARSSPAHRTGARC